MEYGLWNGELFHLSTFYQNMSSYCVDQKTSITTKARPVSTRLPTKRHQETVICAARRFIDSLCSKCSFHTSAKFDLQDSKARRKPFRVNSPLAILFVIEPLMICTKFRSTLWVFSFSYPYSPLLEQPQCVEIILI